MDDITFTAIVYKVQSLAAGGFRVSLDGTSQNIVEGALMMKYADTPGLEVEVTIKPVDRQSDDILAGLA